MRVLKVPSVFTVNVRFYYAAVEAGVMMTSVAIKLFFDSLVGWTGRKSKNIIRIMFVRQISRMQEPRISWMSALLVLWLFEIVLISML